MLLRAIKMLKHKNLIIKAIKDVGSLAELVRLINSRVDVINENLPSDMKIRHTYSTQVSNWINRDAGVAPTHVLAFSQVAGCSCHDLRPDVFPPAANDPSNQQHLA
tara:strand:- start:832 stop:1149 length:318 start_codon:yes stop_codon:yes gene_type:complete